MKLFNIKLLISIALGLLMMVLLLVDIYGIYTDPSGYNTAYHFSPDEPEWSSRSINNYIAGNVLMCVFCFAYALMNYVGLYKQKRTFRVIILGIDVTIAVFMIVGYICWMNTGFDH